jgi:hypothetical protein
VGPPDLAVGDSQLADGASSDDALDAVTLSDLPLGDSRAADIAKPDVGRDVAAVLDLAPPHCPPLGNHGVLNLGHIKQALFARDGRSLLVRIGAADSSDTDTAMLIGLPDGEWHVLGEKVRDVGWLGQSAAVLATADRLIAVSLDGKVLGTIATPTCGHAATPDGSRIYYLQAACDYVSGPLRVLDLASGTSTQLASSVSTHSLAVAPDSRWAAYVAYPGSAPSSGGVIYVVDATGATYAVPGPPSATQPVFVSSDHLLFQSPGSNTLESTFWSHDLGTGNSRSLSDGELGIGSYEIAVDGSAFLMAKYSDFGKAGELYRVPIAGGNPIRLATDLMDYRMYQVAIRAFAFASSSNRVVYIADTSADAGRSSAIALATLDGTQQVPYPPGGEAVVSSYADRVAIIAVDSTIGRGTITIVSGSGAKQFVIEVNGDVGFASFVPGDRGLLLVEAPTGADSKLRYLSFATGIVTTLAQWRSSTLPLYHYPLGIYSQEYPVDPNGCFTVVDSDYDQTASRLVALPD